MTNSSSPAGRRFVFEIELEISSALALSPGELGHLILDGLFELDSEGGFFPGVKVPGAGERIIAASAKSIGHSRSSKPDETRPPNDRNGAAPISGMAANDLKTLSDLEAAGFHFVDILAEQRMLRAKILGLEELYRSGRALSDDDRASAQRALVAYRALAQNHRRSTILAL